MKGRKGEFGVICIVIYGFIANEYIIFRRIGIIVNCFSVMKTICIRNILYKMTEICFQTMLYNGETRYNPIERVAFRF